MKCESAVDLSDVFLRKIGKCKPVHDIYMLFLDVQKQYVYPVNDEENNVICRQNEEFVNRDRLGDFKYYGMDKVIVAVLGRFAEME